MTISDEAVEAAAKALRKKFNGYEVERPWDSRDQRTTYRNDATAALEASAPFIRAEALESASDFIDLPGSSASGYYASEQDSGYREAERHAEAWLRARAAEMRQG